MPRSVGIFRNFAGDTAGVLLTILLTLTGSYLLFGDYLFHPNKYMYAFGGDALVIYYDMAWHAVFDNNTTLTNMNYPFGEYIFLTDAQGALATVLRWVNQHLVEIRYHIVGIVHAINLLAIPLCSYFVYRILRQLETSQLVAIAFAVLITLLAPQVMRLKGHFGLAYPFLIPMTMNWFLRKCQLGKAEWRDLAVLSTLVFFTFNNPYTGFGASGMLLCAGTVAALHGFLSKKQGIRAAAMLAVGVAILAMAIPFLDFRLHDVVTDRIKQQWGFFYYYSSLEGMFYPPHSLLYWTLSLAGLQLPDPNVERLLNIGLVASLLLAGMAVRWLAGLVPAIGRKQQAVFPREFQLLMAGAALMYVYAANYGLYGWAKDWMENHLGPLLMFKASGRLAWPFYFAVTLAGAVFFDRLIFKKARKRYVSCALLALASLAWAFEIGLYLKPKLKDINGPNFFDKLHQQEMLDLVASQKIDLSEYQAMLLVPKTMGWVDHFWGHLDFNAQFYGMRFSLATGLPMVNGMYSRLSVGQAAEAIQMLAHPLIERERVAKLPDRRDLLVLVGKGNPDLSVGEQYIISISTPVYQSEPFSLYRLKISDLEANLPAQEAKKIAAQNPAWPAGAVREGFEGQATEVRFFGEGAQLLPQGTTVVFQQNIQTDRDTQFVFSAWERLETAKYGLGNWKITVTDSTGAVTEQRIKNREGYDIQWGWMRTEAVFVAKPGSRLSVEVKTNKPTWVDELFLYPTGATCISQQPGEAGFLYNGYKIKW